MDEQKATHLQVVKEVMDNFCRTAMYITVEDAEALVNEISREQGLLPLFDPTWYQRHGHNVGGHLEKARAFLAFRKALEELAQKDK